MTQVKKTMAQGFADGKDLQDFYTGIAQDLGKVQLKQYVGAFFSASSGGTIGISSGHTVRPAPGDILILTTGTSTDPETAAVLVTAASSANCWYAGVSERMSSAVTEDDNGAFIIRFSVLSTGTIGTTT